MVTSFQEIEDVFKNKKERELLMNPEGMAIIVKALSEVPSPKEEYDMLKRLSDTEFGIVTGRQAENDRLKPLIETLPEVFKCLGEIHKGGDAVELSARALRRLTLATLQAHHKTGEQFKK